MYLENLFYIKKCLGKNKELITIPKIRTMQKNAEENLEIILATVPFDSLGKPINDPRITNFGKILRRYWIDELPQLYSLAKGDLKLVGIRPKSKKSWNKYPEKLMKRALKQKPGLMAIQYAFSYSKNFEENLKQINTYLDLYKRNPFETDKIYFYKILHNIIINGARSC